MVKTAQQRSPGDLDAARTHLHAALRLDPNNPDLYDRLGYLYYQQNRLPEAITYFQKALRLEPRHWSAHYHLAHSCVKQDRFEEAVLHYQQVVLARPDHTQAQYNLGLAYIALEAFAAAEAPLSQALASDPSLEEAARQLIHIAIRFGRHVEAMTRLQAFLEQWPDSAEAHHNLAILYLRLRARDQALLHFERSLQCHPHNPTALHMCAALKGNSQVDQAPHAYIEALFDQYAPYYEAQLRGSLQYEMPALLRAALGRCLGAQAQIGRVLDLGCGTGRCGLMFRDLALELVGVDLSAAMIAEARRLNTYEQLIQSDIGSYLNQPDTAENSMDIVIASEVLVYIGDLKGLFTSIARILKPGGHCCLSIELLPEQYAVHQDYRLQQSGRFAHASSYLKTLAHTQGLCLRLEEPVPLREDQEALIMGACLIFQKQKL